MKRLIQLLLKPVLIIGGVGTAAAGLYAFWPSFAVENVAGLEFNPDYAIFVRHWGIMVGLMGVMMVAAAFKHAWVLPVLIYSTLEKVFMVYLVVVNMGNDYAAGFAVPATMDAIIFIYSLAYFWSLRGTD